MKSAVLYHSESGNTKAMAEQVAAGMAAEGVESKTFSIDAIDEAWVRESACIILGTPVYYADVSGKVKAFMETMGKYNLTGKLGGAFATANYVHGGGELALQNILTHMMVYGMVTYSGGGSCGNPVIHLGPVGVQGQYDALRENFVLYGRRMAAKANELFSNRATVELLKRRRSCRQFQVRQISDADLQEILDCGLNAPSAKNQQDTKIVVVQDSETIRHLSQLNAKSRGAAGDTDPFYSAPTVCLILAPKASVNNIKDGSLVIGAMQDAAYAIGVGSCWINYCGEMLELSEGKAYLRQWGLEEYIGVGCCILGYPAQDLPRKSIQKGRIVRG